RPLSGALSRLRARRPRRRRLGAHGLRRRLGADRNAGVSGLVAASRPLATAPPPAPGAGRDTAARVRGAARSARRPAAPAHARPGADRAETERADDVRAVDAAARARTAAGGRSPHRLRRPERLV